jgi:hypothetical protein
MQNQIRYPGLERNIPESFKEVSPTLLFLFLKDFRQTIQSKDGLSRLDLT